MHVLVKEFIQGTHKANFGDCCGARVVGDHTKSPDIDEGKAFLTLGISDKGLSLKGSLAKAP